MRTAAGREKPRRSILEDMESGLGARSEHRELAEQILVDLAHIGLPTLRYNPSRKIPNHVGPAGVGSSWERLGKSQEIKMLANHDAQATVAVKSLKAARPFYAEVLGLEPVGGGEPTVQGYKAGGTVILVYESEFAGTNRATVVTWPLGDAFDEVVAGLRGKGVAFETYDFPGGRVEGGVQL